MKLDIANKFKNIFIEMCMPNISFNCNITGIKSYPIINEFSYILLLNKYIYDRTDHANPINSKIPKYLIRQKLNEFNNYLNNFPIDNEYAVDLKNKITEYINTLPHEIVRDGPGRRVIGRGKGYMGNSNL